MHLKELLAALYHEKGHVKKCIVIMAQILFSSRFLNEVNNWALQNLKIC